MSTVLLSGGLLYDGTGNPPFPADILLQDDTVMQVEPAGEVHFPGAAVRDLTGYSVSPGWIDVHAHSDASLLAAPEAFGKISQGITTEVSGNCGLSAFPIHTDEVREHLRILYSAYDLIPDWTDFYSYTGRLEKCCPAVNAVFLCGHNTLRANVSGYRQRELSSGALSEMNRLLSLQLDQGAAGLSTGLLYTPGCFSGKAELLSLLRTTAAQNGIYATHLRNEGDELEKALREAVDLAEQAGIPLQLSHLKTALPRNWHKLDSVLRIIEEARGRGVEIHADRYPDTRSQTSLSIVLPAPFDTMPDAAIRECLRTDPEAFERTLKQLAGSGRDWSKVILSQSGAPSAHGLIGMTIADAAKKTEKTPAELVMNLLREDSPGTMAAFCGMSEENLKRILEQEWVCCGTDETARPADYSLGRSHPRGFGSFPRFIQLLRGQGVPMEKIIRRITSLPAEIFQLKKRGKILPGMMADLVIFDETGLTSGADFRQPHEPAEGIRQVYVNGAAAYDGTEKKITARAGRVLRRS